MRRALAAAAVLVAAGTTGAAAAVPRFVPSCGSTRTLVRSGSVRTLFRHGTVRAYLAKSAGTPELLVCPRSTGRPVVVYRVVGGSIEARRFRISRGRLGFVLHTDDMTDSSKAWVGWVDLSSRRHHLALVNGGPYADPTDPQLPPFKIAYALAADGTIAVMAGDGTAPDCQVVAILPVADPPSVLFTARTGGLDYGSLAITTTSVSWRTVEGAARSVPRTSGSPIAGDPTGGC